MWGAQLENNTSMGPYQNESQDGFCEEFPTVRPPCPPRLLPTSALSSGVHIISAAYSGDAYNGPSTAYFTQYVGVADTVSTFDTGNVTLTVNGVSATTAYGQGSTAYTIAQGLAAAFAGLTTPPATVTSFENYLWINATQSGAGTDYPYTFTVTHDSVNFSSPSYMVSSTSGILAGGATGGTTLTPIYSYTVPSGGYDRNGNVLTYTDTVMGTWNFGYDQLNRLVTANNSTAAPASTPAVPSPTWSQYFCWAYDSFGNRLAQGNSDAAFTSGIASGSGTCATSGSLASLYNTWATYNSQNQLTQTNAPGMTAAPGYDLAGDVNDDGRYQYLYDAEGRICACGLRDR